MAKAVKPIPEGMHSLTPHLICRGASDAIQFYINAFGAVEEGRIPGPDGKIMHAMVQIGDSMLMLMDPPPNRDGAPSKAADGGSTVILHLYVPDVDATVKQALASGAQLVMPPEDMFWGDRYGQVRDPFGHLWSVATHVRDVSPEEMREAMSQQGK
jgi:uncharacterized glyoxalase superfamily protein PhnB